MGMSSSDQELLIKKYVSIIFGDKLIASNISSIFLGSAIIIIYAIPTLFSQMAIGSVRISVVDTFRDTMHLENRWQLLFSSVSLTAAAITMTHNSPLL